MADWRVYALHPLRGFHFGVRGVGVEAGALTGASDTLFGALCQGVLATQGEVGARGLTALLAAFSSSNPPFLISSLFPFAGSTRLLPCPLGLFAGGDKAARKVQYLSWDLFAAFVGAADAVARQAVFAAAARLHNGAVWVTEAERPALVLAFPDRTALDDSVQLWQQGDTPRVTVDRVRNAAQVYQAGSVAFPATAGLYLLIEWRDAAWQPAIHAALEFLGEDGIGGERSAGYGQFRLDRGADGRLGEPAPELPRRSGPTAAMTLALYHPTQAEAPGLARGWYDLAIRRGWVGAPGALGARRKDVLMITAGSVLPWPNDGVLGEMVDVTPATWPPGAQSFRGLLRYGYALPLAVPRRAWETPYAAP